MCNCPTCCFNRRPQFLLKVKCVSDPSDGIITLTVNRSWKDIPQNGPFKLEIFSGQLPRNHTEALQITDGVTPYPLEVNNGNAMHCDSLHGYVCRNACCDRVVLDCYRGSDTPPSPGGGGHVLVFNRMCASSVLDAEVAPIDRVVDGHNVFSDGGE